jgi:hypothetical protein
MFIDVLAGLFELIAPCLTEKQRRLLASAGARALGRGGGARVASHWRAVAADGRRRVRELNEQPDPGGRIRHPDDGPSGGP